MKIASARFHASVYRLEDLPRDEKPEIVFLGRSNVGKSSVINSLLQKSHLARVSSTPGRTRGIHFYAINERFYFVDLPGYGYAEVPHSLRRAWRRLIEGYLENRPQIRLSVLIVDARHEPTPLDLQMREWLEFHRLPYIVLLTKADKLSTNEVKRSVERAARVFPSVVIIPYSARTGFGREAVWREIEEALARLPSR
ncbi:MAG: ribosome biogenesis GTP-binding protein YihA/YsxC [Blastocatellia bacterium]|nr:ribosome biogenesis GTP-binding protein YihA/YsxC [Blastocatellia bacterium]MCS7158409.1 ribosome biogenesis GTP-binding protein YihA/YsxC [Blastocatellia bacterium]MCX7752915.1 ribosome biogenesis GTP-binding protein YihA/YsxC [Blastocatellia bacterium]MDW8167971.1 ribosome biogenesis GTP-binding protein YihA/YsxC [Acidobacteriota bacterium]MDW8256346.1 ribosome biogenesis GTP-binding protein YihA/YsxC [Acidobacteriota bacterium]